MTWSVWGDVTVLDVAREETSLEAKRRELAAKIAEGRRVVDALVERRAVMGRKIEEALEGLQRLQDQMKAIDIIMGLVDAADVRLRPPHPTAPVLEVVPAVAPSQREAASSALQSQPFRPLTYLKCLSEGHDFTHSRAMPGHVTCRRCRARRRT